MPLASEEEIERMESEARDSIGLSEEWGIEVSVQPYLGAGLIHEIDEEEKSIDFKIYSARYPGNWHRWKEDSFKQIRRQLERLKRDGEIDEWKADEEDEVDLTEKD